MWINAARPALPAPARIYRVGRGRRPSPTFESRPRFAWLVEPHLLALLLVVVGSYFLRLGDLSLRGEETRWAQVAREMSWSHDWVVPRQQGEPFLSRPPLQSWLIAAAEAVVGARTAYAIRLPSALAIFGTVLLLYGYTRRFLSPLGSLTAGAAFATMAQVLELGRLAETEALFTFLVSSSLLVWHACYSGPSLRGLAWPLGYTLAALAALTKGPQAPVYFVLVTWGWCLWRRDRRMLFQFSHLVGLGLFFTILLAWHAPLYRQLGWAGIREVWTGDASMRFVDTRWITLVWHFAKFPVVTLACTLPGSLLLIGLLSRRLRASLGVDVRRHLEFLAFGLLAIYPTCWLTPGAQPRYFMPMYPCIAALAGIAVQGVVEREVVPWLRRAWVGIMLFGVLAFLSAAAGALAFGFGAFSDVSLFEGIFGLSAFVVSCLCGAAIVALALRRGSPRAWSAAVLSMAGFCGLIYNGPVINHLRSTGVDIAAAVGALRARLPGEQRLVSFGSVHHAFAFHFGAPIEMRPFPTSDAGLADGRTYFCFNRHFRLEEKLPFEWEQLAVISCSRSQRTAEYDVVIVGRAVTPRPR